MLFSTKHSAEYSHRELYSTGCGSGFIWEIIASETFFSPFPSTEHAFTQHERGMPLPLQKLTKWSITFLILPEQRRKRVQRQGAATSSPPLWGGRAGWEEQGNIQAVFYKKQWVQLTGWEILLALIDCINMLFKEAIQAQAF